jgi:hypothetical protein
MGVGRDDHHAWLARQMRGVNLHLAWQGEFGASLLGHGTTWLLKMAVEINGLQKKKRSKAKPVSPYSYRCENGAQHL